MIKNEKQYRITKAWIRKFEDALFDLEKTPAKDGQEWIKKGQIESIESQLGDLRDQARHYDLLKSGRVDLPPLDSINSIPELLIKWRIKRNWTQRQLADKLGIAEQQIQKYEYDDYATATLETLFKVAAVLRQPNPQNKRKAT